MNQLEDIKAAIQNQRRKRLQELLIYEFKFSKEQARRRAKEVLVSDTQGPVFRGFKTNKQARELLIQELESMNQVK